MSSGTCPIMSHTSSRVAFSLVEVIYYSMKLQFFVSSEMVSSTIFILYASGIGQTWIGLILDIMNAIECKSFVYVYYFFSWMRSNLLDHCYCLIFVKAVCNDNVREPFYRPVI